MNTDIENHDYDFSLESPYQYCHYQYYNLSILCLISLLKKNCNTFVLEKPCLKGVCVGGLP